ncbi:6-phosphogluconolactonase [Streptomyces varsoviensis]|nr:6-phosphogluconolactonase [Streptomyces varsoviensis]
MTVAETPAHLAEGAARTITDHIRRTLARRQRCVLALTGGSTPAATYRNLARMPVPWERVHIVQTDDHLTEAGDGPSWRTVEEHLLEPAAVPAENRHPMPVGTRLDPREAAQAYGHLLGTLLTDGAPDVVVAGLGEDGHTASLFHGDPALDTARWVAVTRPYQNTTRMTLTLPVLSGAGLRLVLATGSGKAAAVARLLGDDPSLTAVRTVLGDDGHLLVDGIAAAGPYGAGDETAAARPYGAADGIAVAGPYAAGGETTAAGPHGTARPAPR